ncbi:hypothetical protein [Streptomyces sp. NPDC005125]
MDTPDNGSCAGRRTFKDVGADLNVNPETLRTRSRDAGGRPVAAGASQVTGTELARLRTENARLAKADKEWQLEREILRRAAAYFAREMILVVNSGREGEF